MDTICRLCAEHSTSLQSIFTVMNDRLLVDMIKLICPVQIDVDDSLPKKICILCMKVVTDAYSLRIRSVQNDLKLRSMECQSEKSMDCEISPNPDTDVPEVPHVKLETEENSSVLINYDDDEEEQEPEEEEDDDDYEPKRLKIESIRSGENQKAPVEKALNREVKKYFCAPPREQGRKGRWTCKLCSKSYAGNVNNLKEHILLKHQDIAALLNLTRKNKPSSKGEETYTRHMVFFKESNIKPK